MAGMLFAPWLLMPLVALLSSALLTGLARWVAPRLGLLDRPDGGRKLHQQPTPVLGGVAFCLAIGLTIALAFALGQAWLRDLPTSELTVSLLTSAAMFCGLGAIDDRLALRPRIKLLGQIIASIPFAMLSPAIDQLHFAGVDLQLGRFAIPFTILWLVACSNVINLIDGLDGLAGSIGSISLLTIAALFALGGQPGPATLSLITAGAILGFLIHNWPPAKIFMGDAGSLTIGFLVGALSIPATSKMATTFTLAVPMVLISVPIFDTFMAIVRRKLNGRGIGEGDRAHIHHRLQDRGLSRQQALLAIASLCLVMASGTVLSYHVRSDWPGVLICGTVLALLIVGRVFGYQETVLFFRHVQELGTLLADTSDVLQTRFLLARIDRFDPRQQLHIWHKVADRVQAMGGTALEFRCLDADERPVGTMLAWTQTDSQTAETGHRWRFEYSAERREGLTATIVATGVSPSGSSPVRVDDLFRLFARVCQELPVQAEGEAEHPATVPMVAPASGDSRKAA